MALNNANVNTQQPKQQRPAATTQVPYLEDLAKLAEYHSLTVRKYSGEGWGLQCSLTERELLLLCEQSTARMRLDLEQRQLQRALHDTFERQRDLIALIDTESAVRQRLVDEAVYDAHFEHYKLQRALTGHHDVEEAVFRFGFRLHVCYERLALLRHSRIQLNAEKQLTRFQLNVNANQLLRALCDTFDRQRDLIALSDTESAVRQHLLDEATSQYDQLLRDAFFTAEAQPYPAAFNNNEEALELPATVGGRCDTPVPLQNHEGAQSA